MDVDGRGGTCDSECLYSWYGPTSTKVSYKTYLKFTRTLDYTTLRDVWTRKKAVAAVLRVTCHRRRRAL